MRTREDTAALVRAKLAYSGNAVLQQRVWTDVLRNYNETLQRSVPGAGAARIRGNRRIMLLAAVVALACGLLVLARYTIWRDAPSRPESPYATNVSDDLSVQEAADQRALSAEELAQAGQFLARKDLPGLVGLLETGRPETKVRVAEYLGQIGDRSVLSALQALAAQWSGQTEDNPFEKAVEAIRAQRTTGDLAPADDTAEPNAPAGPTSEPPPEAEPAPVVGFVADSRTHLPISGALVGLRGGSRTTTDHQGRFALTYAKSHDTLYLYAGASGYAAGMIATQIEEGTPQEIAIALSPGSKLIGTVIDPNGTPIEGAAVNIVGLKSLDWTFVTDANGQFEADGLNPMVRGYSIYAVHPAYPSIMARIQPAPAGQTLKMRFVLKPGVVLFGQVTDADGRPVAGATVGNRGSGLLWKCEETRTDEYGMYQLGFMHTGEHVLWATHEGHAPFVGHARLRPGETERRVDIQLGAGRELCGRVVDDRGRPVPEAVVKIHTYETVLDLVAIGRVCDPNGYFTIPNAPDHGKLRLLVRGDRIATTAHEVDFALDECLITAPRIGRIYGRVLDALTGGPIPRFTVKMDFSKVTLCSATFVASWSEEGHVFDSPEGLFDTGVEDLPVGGTLEMTAHAEGYDPVKIDPVVVLPIGECPPRTEFRLPPAVVFAGRVIAASGRPIGKAQVLFFTKENLADPGRRPSTTTDEAGVFTISGLGPWDLQCVYVSAAGFGARIYAMADLLEAPGWLTDITLEPAATVV
ncbi:MAG: hypothetical protein GY851_27045, partial [bacterium]|nr:hypothetical protein [bacterium]